MKIGSYHSIGNISRRALQVKTIPNKISATARCPINKYNGLFSVRLLLIAIIINPFGSSTKRDSVTCLKNISLLEVLFFTDVSEIE